MLMMYKYHVMPGAPSDQYPVSCTLNKFLSKEDKISRKEVRQTQIQYRNFKKFNENDFYADLISQPFDVIFEIDDPNEALGLWYNLIMIVLNKHVPFIKKRVKRIHQPE